MAAAAPSPPPHRFAALLGREWRPADEVRDAVYLHSGDAAAKQSRFWLLLVISATIASAGVMGDSTATVIGAMIVAPLAIPIQGVGVAIAGGDSRGLSRSLTTLVAAIGAVIGIGVLLGWVLPDLNPASGNSQITSRTSPTLIDLAAASATGFAGALAIARRDIGDILPGVAIAISLVPPLAVVGILLSDGDWSGALGALLLFTTNMLAIVVVCAGLFGVLGIFAAERAEGTLSRRRVRVVISAAVAIVLVGLIGVTARTLLLQQWQSRAETVATDWASTRDAEILETQFVGDDLVVTIKGERPIEQAAELPGLLRGEIPQGTPVIVDWVVGRRIAVGDVP
jgi:uncharacterized hydrophobic protein (TIGR00271 family)